MFCRTRADGNALAEFALSWETQVANYLEFLPLALSEFELTLAFFLSFSISCDCSSGYLDNEPAVQAYAFFGAFHSGGKPNAAAHRL